MTEATNEALFAAYLRGDGDALTLYINGYIHDIYEAEDLMIEAFSPMIHTRPRL